MDENSPEILKSRLLLEKGDDIFEYQCDEFPENSSFYIIHEGKRAIRRRRMRTLLFIIGNGMLSGFLTLARLGSVAPMKYLLSIASIPLEIINLIVQIKNWVDKEKSLKILGMIILTSLFSMAVLIITDAVKWLGWTSGTLATIAACGPYLFASLMILLTILNTVGAIILAKELYQKPEYRTPLKKLALVNKIIRGAGCLMLAGLMISFVMALAANPLGATLILVAIATVTVGLMTWKIMKTVRENQLWKNTIRRLGNTDPYELLGVDKNILELKLRSENILRKNFVLNLKSIIQKKWYQHFGNAEQKKFFAMEEKNTAASYIQQCYEYTVFPAKLEIDRCEEQLCEMQRQKVPQGEIEKVQMELAHARKAYAQQKTNLSYDPERLALLQQAYDLIRKPKGRLKYEKASQRKHEKSLRLQQEYNAQKALNAALQVNQYHAVFKNERGFSAVHFEIPVSPKTSAPNLMRDEETLAFSSH